MEEDDESGVVSLIHNVCIVTRCFVDLDDVLVYLRDAVNERRFRKHATINIFTGTHGLSDGTLGEADEKTLAMLANIRSYLSELNADLESGSIIEEMFYKFPSPILVGEYGVKINLRKNHNYLGTEALSQMIKEASSPDSAKPHVFFFAFCWSHRNELTNFMRELGIISVASMLDDRGHIMKGRSFLLDKGQLGLIEQVSKYHNTLETDNTAGDKNTMTPKNVILFGGSGAGKTLILAEILMMRVAFYKRMENPKPLRVIVTIHEGVRGGLLMRDLKRKYFAYLEEDLVEYYEDLHDLIEILALKAPPSSYPLTTRHINSIMHKLQAGLPDGKI